MRPDRIAAALGAGAAAVLLAAQLLVPGFVGLADNGDFVKVMAPAGLAYADSAEDRHFKFAPSEFAFAPARPDPGGYHTSETLLAGAAARIAKGLGARDFDIRALGALHAALLVTALALLILACGDLHPAARWTAAALLAFVFTDVAYAAPLNSLYGQAASLVFLMLAAGVAALAVRRGALRGGALAAYFLLAALFVCSKPQESLQAPLLAAFGLRLAWTGPVRGRIAAAVLAGSLLVAAVVYFRATPPSLRRVAIYHAVFNELLPHSPDPGGDLDRLGLPRDLLRLSGTTAYDPQSALGDPAFRAAFDARVGYFALARIYVSDPGRIASVLRRAAWKGARMRPPFFGNYPKAAGRPPRAAAEQFALWSDLKFLARPAMLGVWTALLAGTAAAALATWRRSSPRGRLAREGLVLLSLTAALELAVCAFADAHIELVRHLYVFDALVDLVFVACAVWLVETLSARTTAAPA